MIIRLFVSPRHFRQRSIISLYQICFLSLAASLHYILLVIVFSPLTLTLVLVLVVIIIILSPFPRHQWSCYFFPSPSLLSAPFYSLLLSSFPLLSFPLLFFPIVLFHFYDSILQHSVYTPFLSVSDFCLFSLSTHSLFPAYYF